MCGISGLFNIDGSAVDETLIQKMNDSQIHRGPDAEGVWIDNNVGFGHRRLKIIDLSDESNQPMVSQNGRYVITYNGEIYNYKHIRNELKNKGVNFKTKSDTEVILEMFSMYGTDSIKSLSGMFAFAIWDKADQLLTLCRDQIGIKPLYYSLNSSRLIFSSEIKATLYCDDTIRSIDTNSMWFYYRMLTTSKPNSIFRDIKKLEPGTYMQIGNMANKSHVTYYDLEKIFINCNESNKPIDQEISIAKEKIFGAVQKNLVSDVPVGAFLSGGLDSSAIVGVMDHFKNPMDSQISTFSMKFPFNDEFNEEKYAYKIANYFSTNHFSITTPDDFSMDLDNILWHSDEPFGVPASLGIFYLAKLASQEKNKVVLTGDGGDEVFGGYDGFISKNSYSNQYINFVYQLVSNVIKSSKAIRNNYISNLYYKLSKRIHSEGHFISENQVYVYGGHIVEIFNDDFIFESIDAWNKRLYPYYYGSIKKGEIKKRMFAEMKTRLVDEMLTKTDRMTMAHSIEARVPFLDNKLIEHIAPLPSHLKFYDNNGSITKKFLLNKSLEDILPNEILNREKRGFHLPVNDWMKSNNMLDFFVEKIIDGKTLKNGLLNKKRLIKIIDMHKNKNIDRSMMIYTLGMFEIWLNRYESEFGSISIS